jgi:hypothetical protein
VEKAESHIVDFGVHLSIRGEQDTGEVMLLDTLTGVRYKLCKAKLLCGPPLTGEEHTNMTRKFFKANRNKIGIFKTFV